ncbi:MAG: hypothetical protein KY475_13250 [Planctomycetes bacterium]|nr:hypothetical protein [Planctomycetota bacterium]
MLKSHRGTLAATVLAFAGLLAFSSASAEAKAYPAPPHYGPAAFAPHYCPPPAPATKTLCLKVQNPACCHDCATVKVCVPCCCEGPPKVCARCGVLGRGIVTYEWCCGHRVTVVFTALGTVRVR